MFTIDYIASHTKAAVFGHTEQKLTTIDFDTRRLTNNSLFICLTIGTTDGHLYIQEAINRGAKAILLSNPSFIEGHDDVAFLHVTDTLLAFQQLAKAYRRDLHIPVIGITGSNGKTSSKDILASTLAAKRSVHQTHGNFNNHLGVPLTILQTTENHEVLVLEMGMNHAGELDVLGDIASPDYVIITNIGESHVEFFDSREGIAHAKGELLSHLRPGGIAFLPTECEFNSILSSKTNEQIIYYGVAPVETNVKEQLIANDVQTKKGGVAFQYTSPSEQVEHYIIPLYGNHNVCNALPAIFLANVFGLTQLEIAEGLQSITLSSMRFECTTGQNNCLLINDAYNASPTSMKTSIRTFLTTFPSKRRILVLGDMYELGDETRSLHQQVGLFLNTHLEDIECVVTVGDSSKIISAHFTGIHRHFNEKEDAKKWLTSFLHEDFAFFFKASRGMALETIVKELM